MIAWLLIGMAATGPSGPITIPNIASLEECTRLGHEMALAGYIARSRDGMFSDHLTEHFKCTEYKVIK